MSEEIENTILSKTRKLVTLSSLHERYIEILNELSSTNIAPSHYPSWKLKEKLKKRFDDKLLFIAQAGKSDLVCSSEVSIGDALKNVATLNIQINESGECEFASTYEVRVNWIVLSSFIELLVSFAVQCLELPFKLPTTF